MIWLNVLYRHDCKFPFSLIQFAPAGADSCAGVNAGTAAADLAPFPDALTAVKRTDETAIPKTRACNNLFMYAYPLLKGGGPHLPPRDEQRRGARGAAPVPTTEAYPACRP